MNYSILSKYRGELMGLAIIFIVLFHVLMPRSNFFFPLRRLGNVGVDMFLFVSGMGLWFSWTRSRLGKSSDGNGGMPLGKALKQFFSRRYQRVYPAWFIVASVFYIGSYIKNPHGGYSPDIPNLIANVLFNWSFWRADDLTFWYVPATMMLYTFAPFYMEVIRRRPAFRWLPVAFILFAAMVQYVPTIHHALGHIEIFFSRIPIFLIGTNCGKYVMEGRQMGKGAFGMLLTVFILCVWLCLNLESPGHLKFPIFMERIIYIPLAFTAMFIECRLLSHAPATVHKVLVFLGGISLEIYLIHIEFVLRPIDKLHLGYCLTTVCVLAISIPVAFALHWIIGCGMNIIKRKNNNV